MEVIKEATEKRILKMWEEIHKSNILNEESNKYCYDGFNNKVNKSNIIGTVVPQNSRWGITNGYKIIEVNMGNLKIRKLTPKECWRLMGFSDEDFDKASKALNDTFYNGKDKSSSQLYKQAGNSIVVDNLTAIFKNLF